MTQQHTDELFKSASAAWERGDRKTAFKLFQAAAERGHPSAQHNLGYFFDIGEGTRRDAAKALYWYKKAWRNDRQTSSCSNIASVYSQLGKRRLAIEWWKRAVEEGDGDAAVDLAKFLLADHRKSSTATAVALLRRAMRSKRITKAGGEEARELLRNHS